MDSLLTEQHDPDPSNPLSSSFPIDTYLSGTTAALVIIGGGEIIVAWIGDSKIILGGHSIFSEGYKSTM